MPAKKPTKKAARRPPSSRTGSKPSSGSGAAASGRTAGSGKGSTSQSTNPKVPAARAEVEAGAFTSVMDAWDRLKDKPRPSPDDWDKMAAAQRVARAAWIEKDRKRQERAVE